MNKNIDIIDIDDDIIFENDKKEENSKENGTIIKLEKKIIKTKPLNEELDELKKKMIEDEKTRNKLLNDAMKNIDNHNINLIKMQEKIKNDELLKVKYESLEHEYEKLELIYKNKIEEFNNLSRDLMKVRRQNIENKNKANMLKSILEQLIDAYTIYDVCEITRLTEEKLREYLK